ncbi:odorant receptor 4-like isoform X1 [Microplitis mediator]|uniref:odorant receptor 4-like isoform X1 n=1 Tax=Microplitis mediator TaxID=375433 RepID=UPI0025562860|nr:odorant receptor 4-like isoform X1 [Microplitis mediator]
MDTISIKTFKHKKTQVIDGYYVVHYTQLLMKILAVPQSEFELFSIKKIIFSIHIMAVISLSVWSIVFRSLYAYFNVKDFDEQIIVMTPVIFIFVILIKYFIILYRHKEINQSIEYIKKDWKRITSQERKSFMIENARISNQLSFLIIVLMYTSGMFYNVVMPLILPIVFKTNTHSNTSERLPIFPGYDVVFDAKISPVYEITYVFFICAVIVVFSTITLMYILTIVLVSHVRGQVQIIINLLKLLKNNIKDEKTLLIRMSNLIRHHMRALAFSNHIRKTLYELCFVDLWASAIFFCLDEYCFLKMLDQNDFINMIPYAMLFISLNFNILIMCYSSELLDSQFVEIGKETYKTEWYRFSVKIRTYLILIISISQRSQKITAGGIVELSYATYLSIIKTGFAYMQILRAADM